MGETGTLPNKDTTRRRSSKIILRSQGSKQSQVLAPTFRYNDFDTLLTSVCAYGNVVIPKFVTRGEKLEYRLIDVNNRQIQELQFDRFLTLFYIVRRKRSGSVNNQLFANWGTGCSKTASKRRFIAHSRAGWMFSSISVIFYLRSVL